MGGGGRLTRAAHTNNARGSWERVLKGFQPGELGVSQEFPGGRGTKNLAFGTLYAPTLHAWLHLGVDGCGHPHSTDGNTEAGRACVLLGWELTEGLFSTS